MAGGRLVICGRFLMWVEEGISSYLDILSVRDQILSVASRILSIRDRILSVGTRILSNTLLARNIAGDFTQFLLILIENKRNHQPL